jgi:hypothetical protein
LAVDLTVVLTSAVTGITGYSGARLQGRVALAQSRAQTAQANAERDQTAIEKRQSAYHDLLDVIRGLQGQVFGTEPMTRGDLTAWNGVYQHLLNGTELLGVRDVRDAARRFNEVIQRLASQIPTNASTFHEGIQAAYDQSQAELTTAFRDLITAMSADVAPEQRGVPAKPTGWQRLRFTRLDP